MLDAAVDIQMVTDFSKLPSKLQQLLQYWQGKRKPGHIPSRKDIDPIEIPRLMPDVALVDVLRDPLDYRYRLAGTNMVEMTGYDRTGMRMREFFTPEAIAATEILIARLIETREPIAFEGKMFWIEENYRRFQAIVLPLATDGRTVDMAIMGLNVIA
ncbi:MAG: PAS domain-containing protein [Parvibaculum sp.]|uniref:PAS domain-containing protein n=1 Tax=Parvibaculum sp. TaxID=2024848 RepID=UPI0025CF6834|nr:PAS domain-containing protein [Parvibaculum sp.]MCE9649899.1 PAS domain-containing protein [Parvibaculum sp.]